MAEYNGKFKYKDDNGEIQILNPVIPFSNVNGLDAWISEATDEINALKNAVSFCPSRLWFPLTPFGVNYKSPTVSSAWLYFPCPINLDGKKLSMYASHEVTISGYVITNGKATFTQISRTVDQINALTPTYSDGLISLKLEFTQDEIQVSRGSTGVVFCPIDYYQATSGHYNSWAINIGST